MSEREKPSPQEVAAIAEQSVKDWEGAMDALECSTFHGKHAKAIAGLFQYAKDQRDAAKKSLDAAIDQIKHPMAEYRQAAQAVPA